MALVRVLVLHGSVGEQPGVQPRSACSTASIRPGSSAGGVNHAEDAVKQNQTADFAEPLLQADPGGGAQGGCREVPPARAVWPRAVLKPFPCTLTGTEPVQPC